MVILKPSPPVLCQNPVLLLLCPPRIHQHSSEVIKQIFMGVSRAMKRGSFIKGPLGDYENGATHLLPFVSCFLPRNFQTFCQATSFVIFMNVVAF